MLQQDRVEMYSIIEKRKIFCRFYGLLIVTLVYVFYMTLTRNHSFVSSANLYNRIISVRVIADSNRAVVKALPNISDQQNERLISSDFGLADVQQKESTVKYVDDVSRNKSVEQNNLQSITSIKSTDRSRPQIETSTSVVQVGFFEGARQHWNYGHIFQSPVSPRTCKCTSYERKFDAVVTLEKNEARTGKYELLFIPHDVSVSPMKHHVWNKILSVAPPHQRRVYATFEGSWKLRHLAASLATPYRRKAFHWSLTHHSRSDFAQPYGYYQPFQVSKTSTKEKPLKNWAEGKSGLIAWMSTWSQTSWKRANFVEKLQKHIPVHFYGHKYRDCPRNSKSCENKIRGYKFYLALENSCCGEYITEKFWRTLSWDIVPVVLGAQRDDYERLAPPHSFIFIDDFSSMADLANYLRLLDKNDDLYNEYFRWKGNGEIHLNYPPIHEKSVRSKTPPEGFFYSCSAVCRVSEKYLSIQEPHDSLRVDHRPKSTNVTYFDPNVNWWCGSCQKCGKHQWVRDFNL